MSGTDPHDLASVFKITSAGVTNDAILRVSCLAASNRTYQLQRRATLAATSTWVNIGAPKAAAGTLVTLLDPDGLSNLVSFYRVGVR